MEPWRLAVAAESDAGKHAYFFKSSVVFVVIKVIRAGVVGYVQVGPAVVVVVAPDHAQAVVAVYVFHAGLF